jgi:hypothetical protein
MLGYLIYIFCNICLCFVTIMRDIQSKSQRSMGCDAIDTGDVTWSGVFMKNLGRFWCSIAEKNLCDLRQCVEVVFPTGYSVESWVSILYILHHIGSEHAGFEQIIPLSHRTRSISWPSGFLKCSRFRKKTSVVSVVLSWARIVRVGLSVSMSCHFVIISGPLRENHFVISSAFVEYTDRTTAASGVRSK